MRHAAIGFGRELARRDEGVTMDWWKEERGERIFIDFNQNNRDRTIASAYSLRPIPGARSPLRSPGRSLPTSPTREGSTSSRFPSGSPRTATRGRDRRRRALPRPLLALWEELPGGEMPFPPDYPKMPGEPPRVQPSKKVESHWDEHGNRIEERELRHDRHLRSPAGM